MLARIYLPAPNPMQAGLAKTKKWVLEFEPETPRRIEPLMGYTASSDMRQQVHLEFDTAEAAVEWCRREGIPYRIWEPARRHRRRAAYSDNFAYSRKFPWTH